MKIIKQSKVLDMQTKKYVIFISLTWGMAQNRNIEGSRNAAMYFKQSSICVKASVTISFKQFTAFVEFSSYFKSCIGNSSPKKEERC